MKTALTLALSIFALFSLAQTDSILFLGNSYTSTGGVPALVKSLAISGGKSLYIDSYTPGGKQLSQHYGDATSLGKINARKWDYVVLQEQSQMPWLSSNTTAYYAQKLAMDVIKPNHNCTEVITYMTWARKAGNSWMTGQGLTHDQMANHYEDFYEDLWKYVPGRVSPVGKAFHEASRQNIEVYSGDGSHQNTTGSYLCALVFYATIYKESPIGLAYTTVSPTLTTQCQQIAHDIVMTDLYEHNIKKVKFSMSNVEINTGGSVDFTEAIYMHPFPDQFTWTFTGTQNGISNDENPSGIVFNQIGKQDITLEISDACGYTESRTFSDTINVVQPTSLNENKLTQLKVFPTLLTEGSTLFIEGNIKGYGKVLLHDITGKKISTTFANGKVNIEDELTDGVYFLSIQKGTQNTSWKITVQK